MDGQTDGQMDGHMDGQTDGQTDGRTDGWMDRRTYSYIPSPLGSLSENVSGGKNDEFIFIFDLVFAFYYSEQKSRQNMEIKSY